MERRTDLKDKKKNNQEEYKKKKERIKRNVKFMRA